MALDERDLKAISELLDCKFEKELKPIREDISELKADVSDLKQDVSVLKRDVSSLKQDVVSLQSQMNHMEEKVDGIDERLKRVEHNQEQEMFRMNMLYETFIPTHRVTKLEGNVEKIRDDVSVMKVAIAEVANSVAKGQETGFCAATL